MGILMGALGGAGQALQGVMQQSMKADIDSDARIQSSSLEQQRQQALMEFKSGLETRTADRQRTEKAGRINTAATGILGGMGADNAISAYGEDGEGLTPNDISDEEKAAFTNPSDRAKATAQAALQTGDYDTYKMLHDANNKDELADVKNRYGAENLALRGMANEQRAQLQQQSLAFQTAKLEQMKAQKEGSAAQKEAAEAKTDKVNNETVSLLYGNQVTQITKALNDPMNIMTPEQKTQAEKKLGEVQTKIGATISLSRTAGIDAATAAGQVEDIMSGRAEVRQMGNKYYLNMDGEAVQVPAQLNGFIRDRSGSNSGKPADTKKPMSSTDSKPGILSGLFSGSSKGKPDSLETQYAGESREMNDMKRTSYTPEVQAWLDSRSAEKQAKAEAESKAYREAEFKRSQTLRVGR